MNVNQGPPMQNSPSTAVLEHQIQSGAGWLLSIAGFSLINTIAALAGTSWRFVIGLFATDMISTIGAEPKFAALKPFAIIISLVVLGVWALFGIFARKAQNWAFIVGLIFYILDTLGLLLLGLAAGALGEVAINLIFHGLAVFRVATGMKACFEFNKIKAQQARQAYYAYQQQQQPSYYQPQGSDPTKPNLPG